MLPNIKQMGTPEFRQGWRRLPAELKHKILEHFVNAILPACNRSMCVMRKEHLRSATLYEIEGHSGPIERISAHPRFTAKKATLEFNMFQKTR